jgi:hypothetical protein
MTVTADDLDSVISCVMSGLLPITDGDWSVRAGTLEWDCWHTAEHIGDCLMSFAWQLAVQPSGRYVRAVATAEKGASPAEVLAVAVTGGKSWHATCARPRTSGRTIRLGWRPGGFVGMGYQRPCCGGDIAQAFGLGLARRATSAAAAGPHLPAGPADLAESDPWTYHRTALQW